MEAQQVPLYISDPAAYKRQRRAIAKKKMGAMGTIKRRKSPKKEFADLCRWIETKLVVPTGPLAGQKFRLADFQREWLQDAFAPGIHQAGMSIARKNGKSGLIAAVLLAGLAGPLNYTQWRGVVASMTGNLAKELRHAMMLTAEASRIADKLTLAKSPPPGIIYGMNGSQVDFLAADKASGHALGADVALIDEAGQLQENKRSLWNALHSCVSGRNGRFWCISIQADGPMFAEMEARAKVSDRVFFRRWSAPDECDLDDEAAWEAGNPGILTGIKSREYMAAKAEDALLSPKNESFFRAYDLNQSVDPERATIVALSDWKKVMQPKPIVPSGDVTIGIDIGGTVSMTCAAAYEFGTGILRTWGGFGDNPKLADRARHDRVGEQYALMVKQEELRLYPGRVTPVIPFLQDVFDDLAAMGCRVVAIGADRYRKGEVEDALDGAAIPRCPVYWRGMGAGKVADGSRDVREFQKAVITRRLKCGPSEMMISAIAKSVIREDNAGNPALDKSGNDARIDALSASVLAVGIAALIPDAPLFEGRVHVV